MALIVPILRLVMLLLNTYDTFKVLKLPRPYPRDSGQPSVRALSQRKRNMKGCLAVWIVWCCLTMYERLVEQIVSLFIPFYDEVKSLLLLFLIFTRARGAEPIFLHILRPLLRPYTATLDALSDVVRMFGDIIFLMLSYPFQLAASWWNRTFAHGHVEENDRANGGLYAEVHEVLHSVSYQIPVQAGNRRRSSGPLSPDAANLSPNLPPPPPYAATETVPRRASGPHEIWHPPRSAYHDDDDNHADLPNPFPESLEDQRARQHMEEWRQYPPFPSAYPPTPLPPPTSRLPLPPMQPFAPIPEDTMQDFGQSLPSPPELPNSGFARDSSDENQNVLGIQISASFSGITTTASQDETMDEDDEEEEDDFNVTLRTPSSGLAAVPDTVRVTRSRSREPTLVPLPSLLSRISSDTSSVSSSSSASSLVGRKRSRELVAVEPRLRHGRVVGQPALSLEPIEDDDKSAASSFGTSEDEADDDRDTTSASGSTSEAESPLAKKRRVVTAPPSRVQPRRTTRSASREPPPVTVPPPPGRRQRQPRSQASASDVPSAAPSRRGKAVSGAASRFMSSRDVPAHADSDGPSAAPAAVRTSRRAPGVTGKRK
ncbi:hypothetical protein R3P38DRAFT_2853859 [Favolaschia claudopus]|uniref:Protein YOP1 n=1 Tax=Favolaschia claudopus TaxID=2862362 RepID=A0AAW0DMN9_9AGAR